MKKRIYALPSEHYFGGDVRILQLMGLISMRSVFDDDNNKRKGKWWEINLFLLGIIPLSYGILCDWRKVVSMAREDVIVAIETFTASCSSTLGVIKGILLWIHRDRMYGLLQDYVNLWDAAKSRNALTESITIIAEKTKMLRNFYVMGVILAVGSYIIRPFFLIIIHQLSEHNDSYDFSQTIYPAAYTFTIKSYGEYFLCLTYETSGLYFLILYWISCDTLFAQISTHLSIQFKILADDLMNLCSRASSTSPDYDEYPVISQLKSLAKHHNKTLLYCDQLESIFNPIIFLTVLNNGANLCCCIYSIQFQLNEHLWFDLLKNIFHLISLSMQTVMYCGFADRLTQQSGYISQAIYCSEWTDCSKKVKKMLLIIMMRASREREYTVYGVIKLNLRTVTAIANATMRCITLLRSFMTN